MPTFQNIPSDEPIKDIIKAGFDADLPLSGGWGYTRLLATRIESTPDGVSLSQLEHMIASMRVYLEMNMTQPEETRYGSINLKEIERRTIEDNSFVYHQVSYEVSAMLENIYAAFIEEYKTEYGKESFDLTNHFKRRNEATLIRTISYWFEISCVI